MSLMQWFAICIAPGCPGGGSRDPRESSMAKVWGLHRKAVAHHHHHHRHGHFCVVHGFMIPVCEDDRERASASENMIIYLVDQIALSCPNMCIALCPLVSAWYPGVGTSGLITA